MATQIDPNFVITADSFEGYRIVKYLGTVFGCTPEKARWFDARNLNESFIKNRYPMIKMAEERGANAIVCVQPLFGLRDGYSDWLLFQGTAVVIEPLSK